VRGLGGELGQGPARARLEGRWRPWWPWEQGTGRESSMDHVQERRQAPAAAVGHAARSSPAPAHPRPCAPFAARARRPQAHTGDSSHVGPAFGCDRGRRRDDGRRPGARRRGREPQRRAADRTAPTPSTVPHASPPAPPRPTLPLAFRHARRGSRAAAPAAGPPPRPPRGPPPWPSWRRTTAPWPACRCGCVARAGAWAIRRPSWLGAERQGCEPRAARGTARLSLPRSRACRAPLVNAAPPCSPPATPPTRRP
jgi:hypothetical protein